MIYIYILVALILSSSLYIAIRGDLDKRKQLKDEFEVLYFEFLMNEYDRMMQESAAKFAVAVDQAILDEIFGDYSKGVPKNL